jgi:hypothetical protein
MPGVCHCSHYAHCPRALKVGRQNASESSNIIAMKKYSFSARSLHFRGISYHMGGFRSAIQDETGAQPNAPKRTEVLQ